ncbi:MAG: mechanosensitive ion channel [Pseudobacteriovorax sp.]|nr:mechanosensitive ion channel [Pseudobacteriovorax sp.]
MSEHLKSIWSVISQPLFKIGENDISIASVFTAGLILFIAFRLSKLAEKFIGKFLEARGIDQGVRGSIEGFTRYLIIILGFFVTLDTLGISLTSLAALGAVLMVGIGFGLQNITQNFISGIILLLERPIKKGDVVQVGSVTGRVLEIRARSTLIQTRDDIAIIVPNSEFISQQVVNESFSGRTRRLHVSVGVAYGSDVSKVQKLLLKVASETPGVLTTPEPSVVFSDFGASSLDFDLRIWSKELWTSDLIRSAVRFKIDEEFRLHNIEIPFPQRDLHIRSGLDRDTKDPLPVESESY